MLPKKRERVRSGIERAPQREWPRHRVFVRRHECCLCHQSYTACGGGIEFAHVRRGTDGGGSLKPSDWWGISLCRAHHAEQHRMGEASFEAYYKIDMKKLALEFARKSPSAAMRETMKELGIL